jgi:hypothetical protein
VQVIAAVPGSVMNPKQKLLGVVAIALLLVCAVSNEQGFRYSGFGGHFVISSHQFHAGPMAIETAVIAAAFIVLYRMFKTD